MSELASTNGAAGTIRPKVSILMAAYNAARFIGEAVDSVLLQDVADLELVAVDDGSHDRTREILRSYGSRIRLIEQANTGAVVARNVAFGFSVGEYIVIMDADDLMQAGSISTRAAYLDSNPGVDLVYGEIEKIDDHGQTLGRIPLRQKLRRDERPLAALATGNLFPVHAAMVRRRVLEPLGKLHDEKADLIPDWDLWARVAQNACMEYIPNVVGSYRHHEGMSLARLGRKRALRQTLATSMRIVEGAAFEGLSKPLRRTVLGECLFLAIRLGEWKEAAKIGRLARTQGLGRDRILVAMASRMLCRS